MKKNEVYFTLERAADELHVSCSYLHKMAFLKQINAYKHPVNGSYMFKKEDLDNAQHFINKG